ncbi:MAG: SPFH domain-containing protein [Candidatus Aminicenantes bacterium]|nr:SPFH domain-containing protein [Candidatus Aminicenantes bacterium]
MSLVSLFIIIGITAAVITLLILFIAKQYRKVGPNEVLIISGGKKKSVSLPDGTRQKIGFRFRLGGGTFVWPFIETVDVLPVDIINIDIKTPEVITKNGIHILAEATAQVKVGSSPDSIILAAEQFLGSGKDGIRSIAGNILDGKVRAVLGTLTVKEIYTGRQEFADAISEAIVKDFSKMGLSLLSFALKEISDTSGYLESLGKPQIAAAKRDAQIAEAETEKEAIIKSSQARKESEVARLQSEAQIAKAQWENEGKKAQSQVEVNRQKAQADFAYELERIRLSKDIKKQQAQVSQIEKEEAIKLEELEISRKQKELESHVIKPAEARKFQIQLEADAEGYRIEAEARGKSEALKMEAVAEAEKIRQKGLAESETMLRKAGAWDKYNEAAMLELYLSTLPELARAVSEPLSKVDKIVLIGGDKGTGATKLTSQVAEILAQMPDVVESLTGVDLKKYFKNKLNPEDKKES